jgi:glutamate dehydrogenase/leucine dehydrogenase
MATFLQTVLANIKDAGAAASISKDAIELLTHAQREVRVSLPLTRDDESFEVLEGYRVQWNDALGPFKGGIRFHHDVDLDEVRALACSMMVKCALMDIPLGGGKGGVVVKAKEYSDSEKERIMRLFARALSDVVGPDKDVPAPDVNTYPALMDAFADEYGKVIGIHAPGVITGKTIEGGGSEGRGGATGAGAFFVLQAIRPEVFPDRAVTAVVQGFGNAGQEIARRLEANGDKVIAVSDSKGAIQSEFGLDIQKLITHKSQTGTVVGFPGSSLINEDELLSLTCDVLAPSALENVITEKNADSIKAEIVLEVANGPIDREADKILTGKSVTCIPDVLANAGGVVVSYYEWLQNQKEERWTAEEVEEKLVNVMKTSSSLVLHRAKNLNATLRVAAYAIALERVLKAERERGRLS